MDGPIFHLERDSHVSLRDQLRQKLVSWILAGDFPPTQKLPSSRDLAAKLGVSRNTVMLAYQQLIDEGFIVTRERSGLYARSEIRFQSMQPEMVGGRSRSADGPWANRIIRNETSANIYRLPPDWQSYPFPFIDGRFDRSLFPVNEWREANRLSLGLQEVQNWAIDNGESDDPRLISEIRTKILLSRGISANSDEILVTMGAQHGLQLLSEVLISPRSICGIEEPGSPEMRYLAARRGASVRSLKVDELGLVPDSTLDGCDTIHVTPSHQRPTGAVMPLDRRKRLLAIAEANDAIILEDDFEFDITDDQRPLPALKSIDEGNRVVYVASLSKALDSALRIGFIVAAPDVIASARAVRRYTTGHPPLNNQRTAAIFLSLGHYNATIVRLNRTFKERLWALREALNHYLQHFLAIPPRQSGTTYWVKGPNTLDLSCMLRDAAAHGVLLEPVDQYFSEPTHSANLFRMGITSLPTGRIRAGVSALANVLRESATPSGGGAMSTAEICLPGKAIKEALAGSTLLCRTVYGDPFTIEIHPDGTLSGRAGYANEDIDTGRWWVEGDQWYRQWRQWAYGEAKGYFVGIMGDRVHWFNDDRKFVDAALLVRGTK